MRAVMTEWINRLYIAEDRRWPSAQERVRARS